MPLLKNTWSDIKGNLKYDLIKWFIFGAGAIVVTAFYRWIQHALHLSPSSPTTYVTCALLVFIACVLCVIASTLSGRDRPKLELKLGNHVWQYQEEKELTCFFILATVLNRGEPSVALNWKAQYFVGDSSEEMVKYDIAGTWVLVVGDQKLSLTNENLVNLRTFETPIQRGQAIGGRLLLTIPGDRTAQIKAAQYRIEVQVEDYLGQTSKATFRSSGREPDSLLGHYKEQREFISPTVSQTTQPELVSGTPVRELPPASS